MRELTNDEWLRFADLMYQKHGRLISSWPTREESLLSIIQGVIADTSLLCEDIVTLEQWEEAMKEEAPK